MISVFAAQLVRLLLLSSSIFPYQQKFARCTFKYCSKVGAICSRDPSGVQHHFTMPRPKPYPPKPGPPPPPPPSPSPRSPPLFLLGSGITAHFDTTCPAPHDNIDIEEHLRSRAHSSLIFGCPLNDSIRRVPLDSHPQASAPTPTPVPVPRQWMR